MLRPARVSLLRLAIVLVLGIVMGGLVSRSLRFTPYVEEKIRIINTSWHAEIRSNRCFPSCTSYQGIDIRLVNDVSNEVVVLAEGADVVDDALSSSASGQLDVSLRNRSFSIINNAAIKGINVVWHFTPVDDPEDRKGYLAWVWGDKRLEANRVWYCNHMFPVGPDSSRKTSDKILTETIYGPDSHEQHYCLK